MQDRRIVFYTQGKNVPSSRFRVVQIVPHLEKHGLECTILPAYPSTAGDVDCSWVHGHRRILFRPFSVLSRLKQLVSVHKHDIVFIQRPLIGYYTSLLERIVTLNRLSVFDMDDAIFHNMLGLYARKIRRIIEMVDQVVVGNQYLYDFVSRPDKTTIIPTVVDTTRYLPRPDPKGPFTLGWTGLSSNLRELELIKDALIQVLKETHGRLLIVADRCDDTWLKQLPIDFVKWSPDNEANALQKAHVGIMPLMDRRYNRGKCGFKLIQYMACGIPTVATPIGVNREIIRDGIDGFLCESQEQWTESLISLSSDRKLRESMGKNGRLRVEEQYSINAVIPRYLELFNQLGK